MLFPTFDTSSIREVVGEIQSSPRGRSHRQPGKGCADSVSLSTCLGAIVRAAHQPLLWPPHHWPSTCFSPAPALTAPSLAPHLCQSNHPILQGRSQLSKTSEKILHPAHNQLMPISFTKTCWQSYISSSGSLLIGTEIFFFLIQGSLQQNTLKHYSSRKFISSVHLNSVSLLRVSAAAWCLTISSHFSERL